MYQPTACIRTTIKNDHYFSISRARCVSYILFNFLFYKMRKVVFVVLLSNPLTKFQKKNFTKYEKARVNDLFSRNGCPNCLKYASNTKLCQVFEISL